MAKNGVVNTLTRTLAIFAIVGGLVALISIWFPVTQWLAAFALLALGIFLISESHVKTLRAINKNLRNVMKGRNFLNILSYGLGLTTFILGILIMPFMSTIITLNTGLVFTITSIAAIDGLIELFI